MNVDVDFAGRAVIVTGAGRGIGRAEAELLAARGARVCVLDPGVGIGGDATGDDPAAETVSRIQAAGGDAFAVRGSVDDPTTVAEAVARTAEAFGGVDAVVNNAGNFGVFPPQDADRETMQRFLDVHLHGSAMLVRAAWPHLVRSGSGRVVNTLSGGLWGVPGMIPYGSAKGGLLGYTYNLAVAGADHGIQVNAIAPGAGTRMLDATADALPPGTVDMMKQTMPPELVAPVAAYLASAECAISGEVLATSGGSVARLVTLRTVGIRQADLRIEDVRDRLDQILDLDGAMLQTTSARKPVGSGRALMVQDAS